MQAQNEELLALGVKVCVSYNKLLLTVTCDSVTNNILSPVLLKLVVYSLTQSTAYFNPMIDQGYTELYNEAAANGYFIKTKDGLPYNFTYIAARLGYML